MNEPTTPTEEIPVSQPSNGEVPTESVRLAAAEKALEEERLFFKQRLAEFENVRKRNERETATAIKFASEKLLRDLLTPLDNLERALAAARQAGDESALTQGVGATQSMFLEVLKRYGVTRLEIPAGSAFDANTHQAVMTQPSADVPPGHIVQVLEPGYTFHDRVLRPASVIVASSPQ